MLQAQHLLRAYSTKTRGARMLCIHCPQASTCVTHPRTNVVSVWGLKRKSGSRGRPVDAVMRNGLALATALSVGNPPEPRALCGIVKWCEAAVALVVKEQPLSFMRQQSDVLVLTDNRSFVARECPQLQVRVLDFDDELANAVDEWCKVHNKRTHAPARARHLFYRVFCRHNLLKYAHGTSQSGDHQP